MLKANTTILVRGKKIEAGQTVEGLSAIDEKWMKESGYIEELKDAGEQGEEKKAVEQKKGRGKKDGV